MISDGEFPAQQPHFFVDIGQLVLKLDILTLQKLDPLINAAVLLQHLPRYRSRLLFVRYSIHHDFPKVRLSPLPLLPLHLILQPLQMQLLLQTTAFSRHSLLHRSDGLLPFGLQYGSCFQ